MSEKDSKTVMKQISSALDFMHSKQLVHRDVKPENILVFEKDFTKVKLMDFGMSNYMYLQCLYEAKESN
jgi:serine/threonine-protein kinase SBK